LEGIDYHILQRRNHDVADYIFDDSLSFVDLSEEHFAKSLAESRLPPYRFSLDNLLNGRLFVGSDRAKLPHLVTIARIFLHDHLEEKN